MCKPPYMNVREYHLRKVEERKEEEETGQRPASSKREPTVSRSELSAQTYLGIRQSRRESDKVSARNLPHLERDRLEYIRRMENENTEEYL